MKQLRGKYSSKEKAERKQAVERRISESGIKPITYPQDPRTMKQIQADKLQERRFQERSLENRAFGALIGMSQMKKRKPTHLETSDLENFSPTGDSLTEQLFNERVAGEVVQTAKLAEKLYEDPIKHLNSKKSKYIHN